MFVCGRDVSVLRGCKKKKKKKIAGLLRKSVISYETLGLVFGLVSVRIPIIYEKIWNIITVCSYLTLVP